MAAGSSYIIEAGQDELEKKPAIRIGSGGSRSRTVRALNHYFGVSCGSAASLEDDSCYSARPDASRRTRRRQSQKSREST